MQFPHIPIHDPRPDSGRFVAVLTGKGNGIVPLIEYIVDDVVMQPIVTDFLGRPWVPLSADRAARRGYLDNMIDLWYRMGYDFVRYEESLPFPEHTILTADAAPASTKQRAWADEYRGVISSWEDFERYPWPRVEEFDFSAFEYLNNHLPDGMGLISSHGGGVYEHLSWIFSMEGLCNALYEEPDLVRATADRLGGLMEAFYRHILDLDRLVVVFPGDDMGFRTGTMLSPDDLRKYTLPWHKRFAAMAHERGLPYFLHSCGNLLAIMDDLIDDVKIDGKHSYEDAIIPADEFQRRYGSRVAVLGGLDLNILSGGSAEEVRARTRYLLDTCGGHGRYALGSGNSIPSYVPPANYLTMLDETHAWNSQRGNAL